MAYANKRTNRKKEQRLRGRKALLSNAVGMGFSQQIGSRAMAAHINRAKGRKRVAAACGKS